MKINRYARLSNFSYFYHLCQLRTLTRIFHHLFGLFSFFFFFFVCNISSFQVRPRNVNSQLDPIRNRNVPFSNFPCRSRGITRDRAVSSTGFVNENQFWRKVEEEEKEGEAHEGQRLNPSNVSFNLDSVSRYESGLDGNLCFPCHDSLEQEHSVSSIEDVLFDGISIKRGSWKAIP